MTACDVETSTARAAAIAALAKALRVLGGEPNDWWAERVVDALEHHPTAKAALAAWLCDGLRIAHDGWEESSTHDTDNR